MDGSPSSTTRLLNRFGRGDRGVEEALLEAVYGELHRLAERNMRGQASGHTLQPTALVHEAWMRIARQEALEFDGRAKFYALASRVMRSVLVDHARRRGREKRGQGRTFVSLDGADASLEAAAHRDGVNVLALEEALRSLEAANAGLCRTVELRFFGGLTHEEIAALQGVSVRTVERAWRSARAFLTVELSR